MLLKHEFHSEVDIAFVLLYLGFEPIQREVIINEWFLIMLQWFILIVDVVTIIQLKYLCHKFQTTLANVFKEFSEYVKYDIKLNI